MKKTLLLILLSLTLFACSGSDSYQGSWKALDAQGNKLTLVFSPDTLSVRNKDGKTQKFHYSQNSFKFENSTQTYGIQVEDSGNYQIHFPSKNQDTGIILDENGNPAYTIGRKDFVTYDALYKLHN